MCMWCGKPRTPESTLRSGPNTHRGQLPSIKPQPLQSLMHKTSLLWSEPAKGEGTRLERLQEKKKIIIVSKGAPIKVNGGIFRLRGREKQVLTMAVTHVHLQVIFPLPVHWALISGHTWPLSEVNYRTLPATLVFMGTEDQCWVMRGTLAQSQLICLSVLGKEIQQLLDMYEVQSHRQRPAL